MFNCFQRYCPTHSFHPHQFCSHPRSLTLGLSKLTQPGKGTARHKIQHEASTGSGSWEPLPARDTSLGVFVHPAKSQPYPSFSSTLNPQAFKTAPWLHQVLTAYSSPKYCQPPTDWGRTNSYSSYFPRNWEGKGQSLAHPLTSCTVPTPLFPLPLWIYVNIQLKSERF